MFNATQLMVDRFVERIQLAYGRMFGGYKRDYGEILAWSARMALENIANGDALYHNVEHTILVTLVGQEVLTGKHMCQGGVSADDWLHVTISLLYHDIGYIRGVCRNDDVHNNRYDNGLGEMIELPPGASDAAMAPYHVARGALFIADRFRGHPIIDAEVITSNIQYTQFPVPDSQDSRGGSGYADLVRSADLIGQLGDPRYLQKLHALFYEFEETGANARMGFSNTADLRRGYPTFYWDNVYPFVTEALRYLEVTQAGKQILANLYSNVFRQEHAERCAPTG